MTDIVEIDVNTGQVITREYTQAEKDYMEYLNTQLAEKLGTNNGN